VWLAGLALSGLAYARACAPSTQEVTREPTPAATKTTGAAAGVPNLYEAQRLVEDYILNGRYDQDVANVVATARAWLEDRASPKVRSSHAEKIFKLPNPVYYLP
jgi:hypothetical protein